MGRVSRDARLLFILTWTLADDEGRLRANSRMLASLLFPYDDDAAKLIDGWIQELELQGCIVRYKQSDDSYMQICKWHIHQKIDKPSKSKIPAFDESSRILSNPLERSSEDQGSRIKEGTKERTTPKASPSSFLLPSWINKDAWSGFEEMRKKIRAPLTDRARNGIVKELQAMCPAGDDGAAILDQSTRNSWRGVFPLKNSTNGNGKPAYPPGFFDDPPGVSSVRN